MQLRCTWAANVGSADLAQDRCTALRARAAAFVLSEKRVGWAHPDGARSVGARAVIGARRVGVLIATLSVSLDAHALHAELVNLPLVVKVVAAAQGGGNKNTESSTFSGSCTGCGAAARRRRAGACTSCAHLWRCIAGHSRLCAAPSTACMACDMHQSMLESPS